MAIAGQSAELPTFSVPLHVGHMPHEPLFFFFLVQTNETLIAKRVKVQSHPRDNHRGQAERTEQKTPPNTYLVGLL
jgi:hypothetical protein